MHTPGLQANPWPHVQVFVGEWGREYVYTITRLQGRGLSCMAVLNADDDAPADAGEDNIVATSLITLLRRPDVTSRDHKPNFCTRVSKAPQICSENWLANGQLVQWTRPCETDRTGFNQNRKMTRQDWFQSEQEN